MNTDLTEDDIHAQLSSEHVTARYFKGKPLAKWTGGLRDLTIKVLRPDIDTSDFHDAAMLYVLIEAESEEGRNQTIVSNDGKPFTITHAGDIRKINRRRLIRETDDVEEFRTNMNLWLDEWTDEDREEARRLCDGILTLAEQSQVVPVGATEKKSTEVADQQTNQ